MALEEEIARQKERVKELELERAQAEKKRAQEQIDRAQTRLEHTNSPAEDDELNKQTGLGGPIGGLFG